MLRSMTGYGKEVFIEDGVSYLIEIHSVNRKNLDISLFLPKEMLSLDIEIRRKITSLVKRGQVTFKLTKEVNVNSFEGLLPDFSVLHRFKKSWEELASELCFPKSEISLRFLVDQLEKLPRSQKKDLDGFYINLEKALDLAAGNFIKMKIEEGSALSVDLSKHLSVIQEQLDQISKEATECPHDYRIKLESKLQEFNLATQEAQEKLAREVVLYVDRVDLSEEIERLSAHIQSFGKKISSCEESVGKLLDFMVQEMHREANTMTSKSQTLSITNKALTIKSEIEKIREQIQNIE